MGLQTVTELFPLALAALAKESRLFKDVLAFVVCDPGLQFRRQ
jgi:hypothetical protein